MDFIFGKHTDPELLIRHQLTNVIIDFFLEEAFLRRFYVPNKVSALDLTSCLDILVISRISVLNYLSIIKYQFSVTN